MPLPPWNEVRDALLLVLAPAAGASLALMLLLRVWGGPRWAPLAAALAFASAVTAGNYFPEAFAWRLDSERPLTAGDLRTVLGWSLEGKPPAKETENPEPTPEAEPPPLPSPRYWLPWLAALALVIEGLSLLPATPPAAGWVARTLASVLAGRLLSPADMRLELPWAPWALAAAVLAGWTLVSTLQRRWEDGTIGTALGLCFALSAGVLLHAHSARLTDLALIVGAALLGPALVCWKWPGNSSPALAAAVLVLPGLMLNAQYETFSEVPYACFLLAGLATLGLAPLTIPVLARQQGWRRWLPGLGLPLALAVAALVLARQAESLPFE